MKRSIIHYLFFALLFGCTIGQSNETQLPYSDKFEIGQSIGELDNSIVEASGLVASRQNNGMLWTHNDSQGEPCIFLIDEKGDRKWTVCLDSIENRDWEDLAIQYDSTSNKNFIYIAEIGDNRAQFDTKYLYKIEEPKWNSSFLGGDTLISEIDVLEFDFEDGRRDAETLIIDPVSSSFIIVSKREKENRIYEGDLNTSKQLLKMRGSLPYTLMVAGDVSLDGSEILLKNYSDIYYWQRTDLNQSLAECLINRPYQRLKYKEEPQGESIAWKLDGSGFFTVSEVNDNKPVFVNFYKRAN